MTENHKAILMVAGATVFVVTAAIFGGRQQVREIDLYCSRMLGLAKTSSDSIQVLVATKPTCSRYLLRQP